MNILGRGRYGQPIVPGINIAVIHNHGAAYQEFHKKFMGLPS